MCRSQQGWAAPRGHYLAAGWCRSLREVRGWHDPRAVESVWASGMIVLRAPEPLGSHGEGALASGKMHSAQDTEFLHSNTRKEGNIFLD